MKRKIHVMKTPQRSPPVPKPTLFQLIISVVFFLLSTISDNSYNLLGATMCQIEKTIKTDREKYGRKHNFIFKSVVRNYMNKTNETEIRSIQILSFPLNYTLLQGTILNYVYTHFSPDVDHLETFHVYILDTSIQNHFIDTIIRSYNNIIKWKYSDRLYGENKSSNKHI